MYALFGSRAWHNLVPDYAHQVVTAGYGNINGTSYVAAARTGDGGTVIAYLPGAGTITVDMSQLSGPATARWYDPVVGTFTDIAGSPFANAGSRNFTTPGSNAGGNADWVLVLELATPPEPDTQAPTAPGNLTATAVSASQINLVWTASTDNVGVTGYRVERCLTANCTFAQIGTTPGTATTYNDTSGLVASTSYSYQVRAVDAAGNLGAFSNIASATTSAPDTHSADGANGTDGNGGEREPDQSAWTASTDNVGVTGYRVERCQGAGCTTFVEIAAPPRDELQRQRAGGGHDLSAIRVRAIDAAGNLSAYSNIASVTTPAAPTRQAPTAPTGMDGDGGEQQPDQSDLDRIDR